MPRARGPEGDVPRVTAAAARAIVALLGSVLALAQVSAQAPSRPARSPPAGAGVVTDPGTTHDPARATQPAGMQAPPAGLDLVTARVTVISQWLRPLRSPYEGPNSLPGSGERRASGSWVLSLGKQIAPQWQLYLDLRALYGGGLGNENGLGNYANGDYTQLARESAPYVQRAFVRGWHALGDELDDVEPDLTQIGGREPQERIEWKIGRLLPSDDFDELRYAHSPLTQFLNLGFVNNPAWDNAQSGRGTTDGLMLAWIGAHVEWRAGTYRMPTTANGLSLDPLVRSRSDNVEMTLKLWDKGPLWRVLGFRNVASMGRYDVATSAGRASGTAPSVTDDARRGRRKVGITSNIEVPLADRGETGVFACAGWNDGRTEDIAFTEVDRNLCGGVQVSGARWGRANDRFGAALMVAGLSAPHRAYLAAGGSGIQLGDGTLRDARERLFELYYLWQPTKWLQVTPDLQIVANPGFNADRGPARIYSVRLHFRL